MPLTRPRFNQFDTTISSISDPITVLNKSSTLANIDVGFIINRDGGTSSNLALFWQESSDSFVLAFSSNTGEITQSVTNSNITISEYANLRINTLTADTATFSSTGAIKIPSGNTLQRTNGTTGEIRFNTSTSQFEGYQGTSWSSLGGVRSVDNNTYIIAESSPGAGDNILQFFAGGNRQANLNSAGLTVTANVSAGYFLGNGSQLSGIITSVVKIISGNSDITTYEGSNIAVSVGGTANTVVFTSSNTFIKGSLIPTANLTFDLGSPTNRFRSAYFSGSTIFVGNSSISESTIAAIVSFPTGDYGDLVTSTVDAFGVQSSTSFDLNAAGGITVIDLEVLS